MRFFSYLLNHYEKLQEASVSEISSVCTHSDNVAENSLFVALKGGEFDGHDFLKSAVSKGASVLLVEEEDKVPSGFKGLIFKYKGDPGLSGLLNEFYNFPAEKLFTVGVTGTNGKSSFCYLLEHLFKHCGWETGVIGTVDQHFKEQKWTSRLTTPNPSELFGRLKDFVDLSAKAVIMELSSHALDQNRVEGIGFNALVFTNLSQDHLDYHGDMESYFQAKKKIFTNSLRSKNKNLFCLINQDDEWGRKIGKEGGKNFFSYGQSPDSDFCFEILKRTPLSSVFELKGSFGKKSFHLPLPGDYSVYNAVSALSCALLTGFSADSLSKALKSFPGIPGRLEKVDSGGDFLFEVLVDYAHTPQALSVVLSTLKERGENILLVFGCGGDRDKDKRPLMTKEALKFSSKVFFTSDNPRFEEPEKIAKEALEFLSKKERALVTVELNRKEAIKKAISQAQPGDIVLIAGKGHEPFQLVKGKKLPFSDYEVALKCLKEKK